MTGPRGARVGLGIFLTAATLAVGQPSQRTFISLSGSTDEHPRLGNPAIHVEVRSESSEWAEILARQLTADLQTMVHSRPDRGDAPYDYRLEIVLVPPAGGSGDPPLRFEAWMEDPHHEVVWRADGRTELAGRGVDPETIRGVSRNLVSGLVHDGWVVRKLDPEDPPPAAPRVISRD